MEDAYDEQPSDPTDLATILSQHASNLQHALAQTDMLLVRSGSASPFPELLLLKFQNLRIKMDGCRNHARAHVHIDYAKVLHAASYAVDTGELLAGKATPYDRDIRSWIIQHRAELMTVWADMRTAGAQEKIVVNLLASDFG